MFVRAPRLSNKNQEIKYCYLEFTSEAAAEAAKIELSSSTDKYFVDFVGEKSRNVKFSLKNGAAQSQMPINPLRLFINGLPKGMNESKLRMLFPKCSDAMVKFKGSSVGFVSFWTAGDAKSG